MIQITSNYYKNISNQVVFGLIFIVISLMLLYNEKRTIFVLH